MEPITVSSRFRHMAFELQRSRIKSNIGVAGKSLVADFQPYSDVDTFTIITMIAQQQSTGGLGAGNVGAFVCSPEQRPLLPIGSDPTPLLDSNGHIQNDLLGTFVQSDGSNVPNWGVIYPQFGPTTDTSIIIPPRWFCRFCNFKETPPTTHNGDFFLIDLLYFVISRDKLRQCLS